MSVTLNVCHAFRALTKDGLSLGALPVNGTLSKPRLTHGHRVDLVTDTGDVGQVLHESRRPSLSRFEHLNGPLPGDAGGLRSVHRVGHRRGGRGPNLSDAHRVSREAFEASLRVSTRCKHGILAQSLLMEALPSGCFHALVVTLETVVSGAEFLVKNFSHVDLELVDTPLTVESVVRRVVSLGSLGLVTSNSELAFRWLSRNTDRFRRTSLLILIKEGLLGPILNVTHIII